MQQDRAIATIDRALHGTQKERETTSGDSPRTAREYLEGAIAYVGTSESANAGAEGSSPEEQRKRLVEWAKQMGIFLSKIPRKFAINKDLGEGSEHYVFKPGDRWVKITRGSGQSLGQVPQASGEEWVLRGGTVASYLQRLHLSNQVFKDDIVLHAVVRDTHNNLNIIISQPHYSGDPASQEFISESMRVAGFVQASMASSFYRAADNLAVVDLHTENAVRDGDGLQVFDASISRPFGQLKEIFLRETGTA